MIRHGVIVPACGNVTRRNRRGNVLCCGVAVLWCCCAVVLLCCGVAVLWCCCAVVLL